MPRRKTIPTTKLRDFYNILRLLSPTTHETILDDYLRRGHVAHLVDIYEESKKHFSHYKNIDERFRSNAPRKPPAKSSPIENTGHITAIFEEDRTQVVVNKKALNFEYLYRELSPIRTTRARKDTGKSGKGSGIGGIDFIARNLHHDLPILGEIKVNHDQTPFLALIQLLTYLSEMSTPNQRKRIKKWELFKDAFRSDDPFFLYILTCHSIKKTSNWDRILEKTMSLATRMKRTLPEDIKDIVFLQMNPKTYIIRTH
jgi:hypothetical protein